MSIRDALAMKLMANRRAPQVKKGKPIPHGYCPHLEMKHKLIPSNGQLELHSYLSLVGHDGDCMNTMFQRMSDTTAEDRRGASAFTTRLKAAKASLYTHKMVVPAPGACGRGACRSKSAVGSAYCVRHGGKARYSPKLATRVAV